MEKVPVKPSGTSSGGPQPTETIETLPGVNGGGTTVNDIENNTGNNGDGSGGDGFGDETPPTDKFVQGDNKGSDASTLDSRSILKGSAMAVIVAIAYLVNV